MSESLKIEPRSKLDSKEKGNPIVAESSIQIYILGDKYYVLLYDYRIKAKKLLSGLSASSARMHWERADKDKSIFARELTVIHSIKYEVDFLQPTEYRIDIDMENREVVLVARTNPTSSWSSDTTYSQEIIDEYNYKIFNGMLKDLIRLVILSIKFKEDKKNKLLLTGASNKGKTEAFKQMQFFSVASITFKQGMEGTKGWGDYQADGLGRCGLLLVDDIDHVPGLEFKSLTDEIQITVNYKGRPTMPLKFLAMTSTHAGIFDGAGDEIINRVLHMALGDDFIFNDSLLWKENPHRYRVDTLKFIRNIMLKTLKEKSTMKELQELQDKYKMDSNNALSEIVQKTVEDVYYDIFGDEVFEGNIETYKSDEGVYKGIYFVDKKIQITEKIREHLKDNSSGISLDFHKYKNDILNSIIGERTKVGGTARYQILPKRYNRFCTSDE